MGEGTIFAVEQAGCESCAALVRDVLEDAAPVAEITVDEAQDRALVRLKPGTDVSEDDVNRLLIEASAGTGHAYRVAPGSWCVDP